MTSSDVVLAYIYPAHVLAYMYPFDHPENDLIVLTTKAHTGPNHPKQNSFDFENKNTGDVCCFG